MEIGTKIDEQSKDIEMINETIYELDQATDINSNIANEVTSVANNVKNMASAVLEDIKKKNF